jgi:meso-butanediol dehydrogenase / (S,S)-butanediol dehydrogenase / diacetyl reductase
VTGAASGIGRGTVTALLSQGAIVIGLDRDEAGLQAMLTALDGSARIDVAPVDVTNATAIREAIDAVLVRRGHIDVLVNAAGVSTMAPVVELTEEAWDHTFDVNTKGVFLTTRAVLPSMIDRGSGSIVNLASAAGKRGSRLLSHYSASKFAVIGFTQSLALEIASAGIRANSVCPGFITTPMQDREVEWETVIRGTTAEEVRERYVSAIPMGRLGTPDDVARVVIFLASDDARYITGESVDVGGGYGMS